MNRQDIARYHREKQAFRAKQEAYLKFLFLAFILTVLAVGMAYWRVVNG